MGAMIDTNVNKRGKPFIYKINDTNYHKMGSLLSGTNGKVKFTQLYFFDTKNEVKNRLRCLGGVSTSEDFGHSKNVKDIIVDSKSIRLQRISELQPLNMSMQYPILFPYGDDGYYDSIQYVKTEGKRKTTRQFLTQRIMHTYSNKELVEISMMEPLGGLDSSSKAECLVAIKYLGFGFTILFLELVTIEVLTGSGGEARSAVEAGVEVDVVVVGLEDSCKTIRLGLDKKLFAGD
ncbi:ATP-dependent DNA helicase PIF1 [Corchorus olitorius]|uniref:ATP-dependent DNA helicase PIF1 n=1 Tax=Corchorus olitorius TaxID=93759 RepID=A0A1R3IA40_9ROSI|nr:ATP-dependent DNA helicase PIF1 [Corchorus olitorius]